jgi:nucleoside-diphosphate-sugar epimerase
MIEEHFLVTGALGCIGAWVVRRLVKEGAGVTVFDLAADPAKPASLHRLRLILEDEELAQVKFIQGDIGELPAVEEVIKGHAITHIIHLAALQVPFCKSDPSLGARVNVVGTVNVFEAAKRAGLKQVVYASSVAVFGRSEEYPEGDVANDAPLHPHTHYGVYKQANEGTARVYWQDDGVSSIGLRPYTVYGPGRDQGMTSAPTKAMLATAAGKPFHIPFGGRGSYQFVDDVAALFIQCARLPFQGVEVFNLRGSTVHVREIIEAIETAEPAARGRITFDDKPLPFPEGLDDRDLKKFMSEVLFRGKLPETPLQEAVSATIAHFKKALASGRIEFKET